MTSPQPDLETRVRAAVQAIADAPEIVRPPLPVPGERRTAATPLRRWAPAAAALGVLVMILLVVGVPWGSGGGPTPAVPASGPLLPRTFAGLSLLTAKLSDAPLQQPGIAVVGQGNLGTTWGTSQVVVVGADGRTYRRLDLAESRGARGADGEWHHAQALLSPDGTQVAVGDERGGATEIPILDLVTGERRDLRLPRQSAYQLMAWSPDGTTLAILVKDVSERIIDVFSGGEEEYRVALIDVRTGGYRELTASTAEAHLPMAFSADGAELALASWTDLAPMRVVIVDVARDQVVRTVSFTTDWFVAGYAPDLSEVVVSATDPGAARIGYVRVPDGTYARAAVPLPGRSAQVLAWFDSSRMLLLTGALDSDRPPELVELDVTTQRLTVRSTFDESFLSQMNRVTVATGLVAAAGTTDAEAERGPWPWWARSIVGLLFAGAAVIAFRIWRRRRRS